jgi:hypothetical protein
MSAPMFETPRRGAWLLGRGRYRWPEGPADRFAMRLCRRLGRGRSWLHRLGFVVLAAGLKHREQVLADRPDVTATLSGPAGMNVLTSLAVWQCELLQDPRTLRLPRTMHARLSVRGDVEEMPLDRLMSLVCVSDVFDNFCIFWEGTDSPGSGPASRALDHPVSVDRSELTRLGLEPLQRVFALRLDPRRAVHGYLKVAHPGRLIVAVSLPEDPDGFCDAALRLWAPHLQRFQQEVSGTSLCLLNRTVHGAGAVAQPLPGVACVRGLGLGLADALALAQLADVYLGGLDLFGLAAMAAERPGVYLDPAATEESRTDLLWWRTDDSPDASLAALRLLVDELGRPAGADRERA